jgi:chaperonin cofactor prefoldin
LIPKPLEASLGQIEAARQRLADDERTLQNEIETLRAELQKSHDPQRMQTIQEMISVCKAGDCAF